MKRAEVEDRKLELKAKVFKVFSDPNRIRILELLREKECNVSEMIEHLNLKQSTVSQHLRLLKDCGVVNTKKEGREITYSIRDKKVEDMLDLGEKLLVLTIEDLMVCICE
jgi:DNA-binding transcriptional ArsR family regulator